jgi:hypothetical protein
MNNHCWIRGEESKGIQMSPMIMITAAEVSKLPEKCTFAANMKLIKYPEFPSANQMHKFEVHHDLQFHV